MTLNPDKESEENAMRRPVSIQWAIVSVACCLALIPNFAAGQQEKGKESPAAEQKPVVAYKIDFNVREVEDGKRLNSRSYMMMAEDRNWGRIRVGNKVPYKSAANEFQYHDVGMNIDCQPREQGDRVNLSIHVEFSSVAPPAEGAPTFNPVFRTNNTEVQSVVELGKPTLVADMDDVESKRHYEIEVTATKVK